jgi:hypothetical protein
MLKVLDQPCCLESGSQRASLVGVAVLSSPDSLPYSHLFPDSSLNHSSHALVKASCSLSGGDQEKHQYLRWVLKSTEAVAVAYCLLPPWD